MPKAFSERERQGIRERLITAGKRLINTMGLRRLIVDDAAREAGISKGSFYSFFPSREDFILSVFESWEAEYRGALIRQITEGAGTPRERVERFFLGALEILEREPGLARITMREIEAIIQGLAPERMRAHQAVDNRVLEEAFTRWAGDGLLVPGLANAFRGLVAALFSIAMHREDFPPGSYQPAVKLIAEALAMRIAGGKHDKRHNNAGPVQKLRPRQRRRGR